MSTASSSQPCRWGAGELGSCTQGSHTPWPPHCLPHRPTQFYYSTDAAQIKRVGVQAYDSSDPFNEVEYDICIDASVAGAGGFPPTPGCYGLVRTGGCTTPNGNQNYRATSLAAPPPPM